MVTSAPLTGAPVESVTRTRTVLEGGKVLHVDLFFSHYAPVWGGPAEEGQVGIVH